MGEVAGVPVFAPEYLRSLYRGDDGVVIDVVEGVLLESLSIETEHGVRLMLRNLEGLPVPGQETDATDSVESGMPAERGRARRGLCAAAERRRADPREPPPPAHALTLLPGLSGPPGVCERFHKRLACPGPGEARSGAGRR